MSNKQRHEYELKFRFGSCRSVIPNLRRTLQGVGFIPGPRCIEIDYLPDTSDGACKTSKTLLRFRQVEGATFRKLLLTLKIRQSNTDVLHFREYETNLCAPDLRIIAKINDQLCAKTGLILDESVMQAITLDQVMKAANNSGFTRHRILLSKYRENFNLGNDNATIDFFPDDMGVYIEFESHSAKALHRSIERSGYDISVGINTDYGDILKIHKANLLDKMQRTALFSESESAVLNAMIKGNNDK